MNGFYLVLQQGAAILSCEPGVEDVLPRLRAKTVTSGAFFDGVTRWKLRKISRDPRHPTKRNICVDK